LTDVGSKVPSIPAAIVGTILTIIGLLIVGRRLRVGHNTLQFVVLFVSGVAYCAVVLSAWNGFFLSTKLSSSNPAWTRLARSALSDRALYRPCASPPSNQSHLAGFGPVGQICIYGLPGHSEFAMINRVPTGSRSGILYSLHPGDFDYSILCVSHIDGPWWEYLNGTSMNSCPIGYTFTGSP
jgi:hypothetical protein